MRTVWKYDVAIDDGWHNFTMPAGAEIVHAAVGPTTPADHVSVWAVVDPDASHTARTLRVIGTGHPFSDPDAAEFWCATAVEPSRPLVWHVVELIA